MVLLEQTIFDNIDWDNLNIDWDNLNIDWDNLVFTCIRL